KSGQTFFLAALPLLLWFKKHELDVYNPIHSSTMLNDRILYKLSCVLQIDPPNGCTTGIFDLKNRRWDNDVAEECGTTLPFSPKVNEAGTVSGNVVKDCAPLTGLREGMPVVSVGGDAQMESRGTGVLKPNQTL
ncbi:FGGY family carbohydrate kinase, partial [Bacillus tropicus]|uniref:FGGY family carbohydrate kinase n=1 Tax=Bacillus tropicus TaxID=2026188 RepID=UPI00284CEC9B